MAEPTLSAFLELARRKRGHFQLESGHHGAGRGDPRTQPIAAATPSAIASVGRRRA
jgi:hypothetical protein